jgi:hypothetical protein
MLKANLAEGTIETEQQKTPQCVVVSFLEVAMNLPNGAYPGAKRVVDSSLDNFARQVKTQ